MRADTPATAYRITERYTPSGSDDSSQEEHPAHSLGQIALKKKLIHLREPEKTMEEILKEYLKQ